MPDLKNNAVVRFRNMLIEMQLEQADIVGAITITNEDTEETMTVELPTAGVEDLPETEGPVSNAIVRFRNMLIEMQLSQDGIEGYVKITDDDSNESIIVQLPAGVTVESIAANYTQSVTVYTDSTLDSLRNDLIVTATYSDETTAVVEDYTLSGELTEGISVITVTYAGKTTTFNVEVSSHNIVITNVTYPYTAPTGLSKKTLSQATVKGKSYIFNAILNMDEGSSLRVNVGNSNSVWFTILDTDVDAQGNVSKQVTCGNYNAGTDIYLRSTNGTVIVNDCYFVEV